MTGMKGAEDLVGRNKNQGVKMKKSTKICLTVAAFGFSVFSAFAVPTTPTDITLTLPLNGSSVLVNDINANALSSFGPGKSPAADLGWLQADVYWYNLNYAQALVGPSDQSGTSENIDGSVSLAAGDYLVLHYGSGPGGTSGGGILGLYFGAAGTFDIPQKGSGPNGFGGISYAELFTQGSGNSVPDGGSTAMLLGSALAVIGLIRRKLTLS